MWAVIATVIAVVVVCLLVAAALRYRRHRRLRTQYGPEYDRMTQEAGGRRQAERELRSREQQRSQLDIHEPTPAAAQRYLQTWQQLQQRFVDAPVAVVGEADRLVYQLMTDCGYPAADFEERAGLLSVEDSRLVTDYRDAHQASEQTQNGSTNTEQLRAAMLQYRSLIERLLGQAVVQAEPQAPVRT
jgi:hypothetical protein